MKNWMKSIFKLLTSATGSGVLILIVSLITFGNAQAQAVYGYPNWQIESDLQNNVAFERNTNANDTLYSKSQYIGASDTSTVTSIADFHAQMKLLGTQYLPKPMLIPIGMDGLPIFIPTYPLPKLVGDPFVQRLMILDQLRTLLGSTIMAGRYESEPTLINALYSSGKEYARLNNLVLGSALSLAAWQASGYGDIIWPEFRVIQGETVLVPVVYLSAQSLKAYALTEHINDLSLTSATLNSLTISPSASMIIRSEVLRLIDGLHDGGSITVAESNREIVIGGALDVYGGSITAEQNLTLSARAINLRPLVILGETLYGQEEIIASVASVTANNGTMLLNAYRMDGDSEAAGNIRFEGAQVSGKNVTLQASGNIDILAAQLQRVNNEVIRGGSHDTSAITFVQSQVSGLEALNLIADGYVNVKASDLVSAQGTINILAGNGIYIENELGVVQEQMHQKVRKTTRDMSHFQTMAISANLRAGKGIVLNTENGPIRLKAVNITSQDGAKLNAENGKIELLMAKEQDQYHYNSIKEKLLTIKTEMESWDKDTPVYNTIIGGLEVNATRGITVEYGGIEGATARQQIDAMAELSGMAGMEWFANLKNQDCASVHAGSWLSSLTEEQRLALIEQQNCVDFGFVELMDQYDYEKKTNLSPAAMAIIAIAVIAATGGAGAGVIGSITGTTLTGASAAMASAAFTTLVTQATQITITTGLNGGSPYDAWKELGSKENIRQLATSIATAGALSYADKAMGFTDLAAETQEYGFLSGGDKSLNFLDQSIQVVTHATVASTIDVLAQGKSLSDFGSNFQASFTNSLKSAVVQEIGQSMATAIGTADLNTALTYIGHAALGCVTQGVLSTNGDDAKLKCFSGAAGAVIGEYVAADLKRRTVEEYKDWLRNKLNGNQVVSPSEAMAQYMKLVNADVDIAKLTAAMGALLLGGDVDSSSSAAGLSARFNQNHDATKVGTDATTAVFKELVINGEKLYRIIGENGEPKFVKSCPRSAGCYGLVAEDFALSESERELVQQKKEYMAKKLAHEWYCLGKPSVGECASQPLLTGFSDKVATAAENELEMYPNEYKSMLTELNAVAGFTGEVAYQVCFEAGPCETYKEGKRIASGGAIDETTIVIVATTALGGKLIVKVAGKVLDVSVQISRREEVVKLFTKQISGIDMGKRSLIALPNSTFNAKIFSGASEDEVFEYVKQISGVPKMPEVRNIPGQGRLYVFETPQGNFNLRDFARTEAKVGKAWTLEVPDSVSGLNSNTKKSEIKFLME